MITGFNTDVEYEGVTYHIQTEDKGVETPLILSLVYNRGTILASKRSPYDDLLSSEFDEKVLAARLQKQHKLMCAAVRTGRIEDLKRMTLKDSAAKREVKNENSSRVSTETKPQNNNAKFPLEKTELKAPRAEPKTSFIENIEKPVTSHKIAEKIDLAKAEINLPFSRNPQNAPKNETPKLNQQKPVSAANPLPSIPKPKRELEWELSTRSVESEVIIEAVRIIEDEVILPAEAVEIVTEPAHSSESKANKLKIELLQEINLKGGDRKTISVLIRRGASAGIGGAQIMVKVLGSSFRPLIFHAKSDKNGVASIHLQLPHFREGRAALLIRAMNAGEQVELRRAILHG
ncbi:MAG: hypothetical protein JWN60_1598 [Acidobacteria bacterium]|nr:hypothetical protein [Acidobacteriota bacterium]